MELSNVLLNASFKAVAKGNNLTPIEHEGEFLVTADSDHPVATLKEIAEVNGFKIDGKLRKRSEQNKFVFQQLNELKIAESTMSKLEKVLEIVNPMVAEGKDHDEIRIAIIQSGVSFKEAGTLFTKAMEAAGHSISPKARKEKIEIILEEVEFNPSEYSEVEVLVQRIAKGDEDHPAVPDTTEKQALAAIRKWCKDNEIELPKAPKKSAGRASGGSIVGKTLEWLLENKEATVEEVREFVFNAKEGITEPQAAKYISTAMQALEFARKFQG